MNNIVYFHKSKPTITEDKEGKIPLVLQYRNNERMLTKSEAIKEGYIVEEGDM